jgi:MFS family permease
MDSSRTRALYALAVLFSINAFNFFDRQVLGAVTEPLRRDWGLTDTQLGWLGTSFILLYAVVGVPFGRMADSWNRKWLLALGLVVWSALTAVSGMSRSFWSLFALRLGVGVGEATCAPASTSLIGDLFRPGERGRALSIFMLGLPVGLSLSYLICGAVAQRFGWRAAFIWAGIPGFVLVLLTLLLREPDRGMSEDSEVGSTRRPGSPYFLILSTPTMLWIIASGAAHNFNMYAISTFLPAFLTRYHGASIQNAGFISGILIGVVGGVGTLLGGWMGDAMVRKRPDGRLLVACLAILVSVPASVLALSQKPGSIVGFTLLQALASMMMYVYYPTVYSTIHDILEPSLRGTGMAVYFMAMYLFGAALGPVATGWLSDYFARSVSLSTQGGTPMQQLALESFKALGLLRAMYVIPVLGVVLAAILFAGSRTVGKDVGRLVTLFRGDSAL